MDSTFPQFLAFMLALTMLPALGWLVFQSVQARRFNKPVREGMNRAYKELQNLKLNGTSRVNTGRMHLADADTHFQMALDCIHKGHYSQALVQVKLTQANLDEAAKYFDIKGNHPIPPSCRIVSDGSGLVWLG
ncbi:MAG TPA: hypothetical protein PL112_16165 [Candidatus Obscuribacter sp.]|nr:hypothetical protein [Candidatus Obscuribacter sp.]MBK9280237.1 hypothetical protein [Candidatus Obscuribacter sp.]MBL8083699.1 hypothetical protein [Candidatus Obscuribacter sp.]HMY54269.1 hypothetical protein [Candidatus Obscuribacter sp.]HND05500.1 hypothetical protein [Candidatus Obscuribacter sp.]